MRRNRSHNQPNHNAGGMLSVLGTLALLVFVSGCQRRELVEPEEAGQIRFVSRVNGFAATESGGAATKSLGTVETGGVPSTFYLHVTESDWPVTDIPDTKSEPVTSVHSTMKVSGYSYSGAWDGTQLPNLFEGVSLTKSGSTWTGLSPKMQWPGAEYKVRFGAMSPASGISGLYWNSDGATAGMPVIEYRISDTIAEQVDILECTTAEYRGDGSDSRDGVEMDFRHALTAIKFRTDGFGISATVKSVSIKGVYGRGTHVIGSETWTPSDSDAPGTHVYSFEPGRAVGESSSAELSTEARKTLLLMPQTCPASAKFIVVLTIGGADYKLEASLAGQVWAPGKEITYTLSSSDADWKYTPIDVVDYWDISIAAGTEYTVAKVKSYQEHALTFKRALPWHLEYSTDGGTTYNLTKPSWVSISPESGPGGWAGENIKATITRVGAAVQQLTVRVVNDQAIGKFDFGIEELAPFGGFYLSPPVFWNGTDFEFSSDWKATSYGDKYGMVAGSSFFSFIELGQYFDEEGSSFSLTSGDISDRNRFIENGNSWFLPSHDNWDTIIGTSRVGATVNGTPSCHFAFIQLDGVTYSTINNLYGVLLFPDYGVYTGRYFGEDNANIDNKTTATTGVTESELNAYLDQGCVFLPSPGSYVSSPSQWAGGNGYVNAFHTSNSYSDYSAYYYTINSYGLRWGYNSFRKDLSYLPIRLICRKS